MSDHDLDVFMHKDDADSTRVMYCVGCSEYLPAKEFADSTVMCRRCEGKDADEGDVEKLLDIFKGIQERQRRVGPPREI